MQKVEGSTQSLVGASSNKQITRIQKKGKQKVFDEVAFVPFLPVPTGVKGARKVEEELETFLNRYIVLLGRIFRGSPRQKLGAWLRKIAVVA